VETEGAIEAAWEKNQAFLASAAGHVAKKNSPGMSLTCPFCAVRKPEPVTSSRETLGYRPEDDSRQLLNTWPNNSFIVHSWAPWMNERSEKENVWGYIIRRVIIIEQRISVYGKGTALRK
jgi:hypothetical protein